jgi:hypothetical protein
MKKIVTFFTTLSLLMSCAFAPAVEGAMDVVRGTYDKAQCVSAVGSLDTPLALELPASIGRITGVHDCGSDTVVINIQDIYCHAQVQRNIAKIIIPLRQILSPIKIRKL